MNQTDLQILLESKISLMVVETYDESRALNLLNKYFRAEGLAAWVWTASDALSPLGFSIQPEEDERLAKPEAILRYIKKQQTAGAFVLCDFHPYLDEPVIVRLLKDIALNRVAAPHKVVLVSYQMKLPPEVQRYSASLSMDLPTEEEILAMVRDQAKRWSRNNGNGKIKTDNVTLQKLVNNLKGLPHQDVKRLAMGAIADDGAISDGDLPEVTKAKFALMDMDGVLHFEYATVRMDEVAGLARLKGWLADRKGVMLGDSDHLDPPKGVLLLGVQGGGKSLAAKSIAGAWGLPLLRLDMAALFNKYVGETERNLRDALKLADTMEPCVLWLDEIEKGLAQGDSDNATTKRLLGTILTWMAERTTKVFMVATSNDISELPPELMRKGRFDEIFFVDLPAAEVRKVIFEIHLKKRGFDPQKFTLGRLVESSDGFTGAEIEQAVVSATYSASAQETAMTEAHIEHAVVNTQPLSVVMAEKVAWLRAWADERAVKADAPESELDEQPAPSVPPEQNDA